MDERIYLDYNATAPVLPQVREAILAQLSRPGNASSIHGEGRKARMVREMARQEIADWVATPPETVIFTSGGTEANDLAINGSLARRVIVGATEHDAVLAARSDAQVVSVDRQGLLDLSHLAEILGEDGRHTLVSVMLANNETGVINPIRKIADIVHERGGLIHCDAVQALGKIPVSMAQLDVDFMSLSAHKIGGPQGIGALIARLDHPLSPRHRGGGQEKNRRGGTENLPAIAGFQALAQYYKQQSVAEDHQQWHLWHEKISKTLTQICPAALIIPSETASLANTLSLYMPGVSSQLQIMKFDLAGMAVSAGSACSSGKTKPSHVLRAMGLEEKTCSETIRVSFGWKTTEEHLMYFASQWQNLYAELGQSK